MIYLFTAFVAAFYVITVPLAFVFHALRVSWLIADNYVRNFE